MGTHLPDPPFMEHDDLVCVLNGRYVCHYDAGASRKGLSRASWIAPFRYRCWQWPHQG